MKRILFVLLILITGSIFSQSFLSLDGIETPNGETILLYHLGYPDYREYAPVYKYNVSTGSEEKIMDAFFVNGSYTRSVQDFEFFPDDTLNFINCGFGMMPDNYGFVAYNDSSVSGFQSPFYYVDISEQNPSRTYAGDGMLNRSFDGGLTYPQDSILDFHMISVSDFNDNEIFGIDSDYNLVKSFDGGHTSIIVDDLPVHEDLYFQPKLYYDPDQSHIYRTNISALYNLYVSDGNGNSYTWQMKGEYPEPFVFANDPLAAGTCYLAYYYHLYKSADYCGSFSEYYLFNERITGIYPRAGTQILYVSTQYHLYKLENNTITTLKEILSDPSLVRYYPLQTGNLWVYDGFIWTYPETETYQFIRRVNDEVIKPNQKKYFEVEEYYAGSLTSIKYYERVDTVNAKVYRFDEDSVQSGQEYLLDDLRAEMGDSVRSCRFQMAPCTVTNSGDITYFQVETHFKEYYSVFLESYTYQLIKDFGMTYVYNTFDFGSDTRTLKGAYIGGVLYGDTTVTGIDNQVSPVGVFSLFQNYPNPFNPTTTLSFVIGQSSFVSLKIYDVLGNEVAEIVNEEKPSGTYNVKFDGSDLSSGVYICQMRAGNFTATQKLILLK